MCFKMSTPTKCISASQVSARYEIREITARLFILKVRETMKSSENHPAEGIAHCDAFVVGAKEKNKLGKSYNSEKKKATCH